MTEKWTRFGNQLNFSNLHVSLSLSLSQKWQYNTLQHGDCGWSDSHQTLGRFWTIFPVSRSLKVAEKKKRRTVKLDRVYTDSIDETGHMLNINVSASHYRISPLLYPLLPFLLPFLGYSDNLLYIRVCVRVCVCMSEGEKERQSENWRSVCPSVCMNS